MKAVKFYRYLAPYWKKEALILLLSALGVLLGLVNPYLTKLLIDNAYGRRDLRLFISLIAVGAVIFIFNGALSGLNNYLNRYIRLRVGLDLNRRFFKKLQRLPYSFFCDSSTATHIYKINYDIGQAASFVADTLPQAVSSFPRAVFISGLILYLNWKMGLFALALAPFLYFVPLYFANRLKKIYGLWIENSQGVFKKLHEALSHIQLVKAFGQEARESNNYVRNLVRNIRFSLDNTRLEVAGTFANAVANRIILGLIIFYGGYQVIKGRMTLGDLSAISIYLAQLSGLQNSTAQFFQRISLGAVSCARIDKILEARPEFTEEKSARPFKMSAPKIEFKKAGFSYSPGKMILDNVSFSIPPGSCIGLAGPSGSGKTTIINLLLRLYGLGHGEIIIDGQNIRNIRSEDYYRQIGAALQEPFLWDDTVANNIRYGREDAAREEIEEAARIACIDGFVKGLPDGYETVIGENACKISEGQKQRIAVARALIKRPKILILDEALSCVDMELEAKVIGNIKGFLGGSTQIMVSHRPSVIERTERVYFLENTGRMISGTHEELLKNNLRYQRYFSSLPQVALSGAGKEVQ